MSFTQVKLIVDTSIIHTYFMSILHTSYHSNCYLYFIKHDLYILPRHSCKERSGEVFTLI